MQIEPVAELRVRLTINGLIQGVGFRPFAYRLAHALGLSGWVQNTGGLTAALNEIADTAQLRVEIDEDAIPVSDEVRGACELLGLDPYYVANEGRFIAIVSQDNATAALAALRQDALCANACLIGRVEAAGTARVVVRTRLGSTRILDLLSGEQLPRIC